MGRVLVLSVAFIWSILFYAEVHANSDERWSRAFASSTDEDIFVSIEDVPVAVTVSLVSGGKKIMEVVTPQERGLSAYFIVPKGQVSKSYAIELEPVFFSDLELNADIKIFVYRGVESERDNIVQALSLWSEGGKENRSAAIILMKNILKNTSTMSIEVMSRIIQTYVHMLIELEQYDAAKIAIFDYKLKFEGEDVLVKELNFALAKVYDSREQTAEAIEAYEALFEQRSLELKESGDLGWLDILLRIRLGALRLQNGYYQSDKSIQVAGLKLIKDAEELSRDAGDYRFLGTSLNAQATYYWLERDFVKAELVLLQAMKAHTKAGKSKRLADVYNNLAVLYRWMGKSNEAINLLGKALKLEQAFPVKGEKGSLLFNLARSYLDIGQYQAALRLAKRARELFHNASNEYGVAETDFLMGNIYRKLSQLDRALIFHLRSLDYFSRKTPDGEAYPSDASNLRMEIVQDYLELGELHHARYYAEENERRVLDRAKRNGDGNVAFLPDQARGLLALARVALHEKEFEAFARLKQEVSTLIGDSNVETSFPILRLELFLLEIALAESKNLIQSVEQAGEAGMTLIAKVRGGVEKTFHGPAWSRKSSELLDAYAAALFKLLPDQHQKAERLFLLYEKFSALNYRESRHLNILSKGSERKVSADFTHEEEALVNAQNAAQTEKNFVNLIEKREILASEESMDNSTRSLPELAFLEINELQRYLNDEVFIRYIFRERVTGVLIVTKNEWNFFDLPPYKEIEPLIAKSLNAISSFEKRLDIIQELSRALKVSSMKLQDERKVILVTDGLLNNLPFGLLNIGSDALDYSPISSRVEIVRTLSASDYFIASPKSNIENQEKNKNYDIAVFADPIFNKSSSGLGAELYNSSDRPDSFRNWSKSLRRLPWTAKEASQIVELFGKDRVKLALRGGATQRELLSPKMRSSKILHIASHGYFDDSTPDIVGIATTPVKAESGVSKSFLTLSKLLTKKFYSNLVVVSGCETNLGVNYEGEGANNLTRGFLVNGAGSVIGTLWSIPDRPTAFFMEKFYYYLKLNGGDASNALAQAKKSFIQSRRYKHPYFWAGFILTSANRAYETNVFR